MVTEIIRTETVLGKSVRVYGTAENPLFVAKNVADWIGHSDANMMCKGVDEDEKLLQTILGAGSQQRQYVMLTEFGMYEVLFQSRKPVAKAFKKEVKRILHELRTTGFTIATNITKSQLAQMVIDSEKELEAAEDKLALQEPMVKYHNKLVGSPGLLTTTIIAKGLGMAAVTLNKKLHAKGIQFQLNSKAPSKNNNPWLLYAKYQDKDYAELVVHESKKGEICRHLKWTEKGAEFIHNLFNQ